jgi:hypothetical protein
VSALTAEALLAGPRGRDLCVNLLDDRLTDPDGEVARVWADALQAMRRGDPRRAVRRLSECVRLADLSGAPPDARALHAGLTATVDFASYWGRPDEEDRGSADPAAREALRPVAEAVVAAASRADQRWWAEPADRAGQRCTQFLDQDPFPEPVLTGTAALRTTWLAGTQQDERSAHRSPENPDAPYGGPWWSTPEPSVLPRTTRRLPELGAVGLALVEDGYGWRLARCWPVAVADGARIYEVDSLARWAELVRAYPLEVSRSRRHVWWNATGRAGRWLIPDYAAAAADWDAIHLSVAGYLTAAGLPAVVGADTSTLLAGWHPDATWWLSDVLSFAPASPPELWREDDQAPFGWSQE